MADKPAKKRTKPRLVKASAAKETVRERAAKANKPKRTRKISEAQKTSSTAAKGALSKSFSVHDHDDSTKAKAVLTKHRSFVPKYFRESYAEIKQVQWPSFKEAIRLTFAVFAFAVVFAAIISSLDWILAQGFDEVILNGSENIKDIFN